MKIPSEHPHIVDYEKIKRESFVLLNLGYGFFSLRNANDDDVRCRESSHIFHQFSELYTLEISSLLTSLSISSRILDDLIRNTKIGISAASWKYEDMIADDGDGNRLTLRDCFNKTIHAERIDYELMQMPDIYLYGKQQKKDWTVCIYFLPFFVSLFQWVEENRIAQQRAAIDAATHRE